MTDTIPEGFERLEWADVKQGDQVFIAGQRLVDVVSEEAVFAPCAYGPHTVVHGLGSIVEHKFKVLQNVRGKMFLHHSSHLLKKKEAA